MSTVPAGAWFDTDYKVLFDLAPLPAWVFDVETLRVLAVNDAAVRRYGYSRDEFLNLTVDGVRPPEEQQLFRDALRQPGAFSNARWHHRTRTGDQFDVEVAWCDLTWQGRPARLVFVSDVTARRRVEEALEDSQRRLQALFASTLDATVFVADDGRFIDVNPAACELFGRTRDELVRLCVWDVVPPENRVSAGRRWRRFLTAGTIAGDYRILRNDGALRHVECRGVAGVLPGIHLAAMRDVTEQKRIREDADRRLRESHDQLRRVSARARARREDDRTRLARELHDQLGQALTALKMDLCWLASRESATADLDVRSKLSAMTTLVDDTIASVRRISSELRPSMLDKLGLVAALEWQAQEFERRTGIRTRIAPHADHVALDPGRATAVFRIFQEVLANIANHAGATNVEIELDDAAGSFALTVRDNGRGIEPGHVASGKSLGLIGIRERTTLLGGAVDIHPAGGAGTVVAVVIPLAERRLQPRDSAP